VRVDAFHESRIVVEQFDDRVQALPQRCPHLRRRFKYADAMPCRGEQIGDAVPHQAAAHHADFQLLILAHLFLKQTKSSEPRAR
jgi:hypothetical protein